MSTYAIAIRYNVYTGESVFSNGNTAWDKIVDETLPPKGFYEV